MGDDQLVRLGCSPAVHPLKKLKTYKCEFSKTLQYDVTEFTHNQYGSSMLKVFLLSGFIFLSLNAQAQMAIDFEWRLEHRCSKTSPVLIVTGVPTGAARLAANMIDNDMISYVHGGGSVDMPDQPNFEISSGALKNYKGPCPPNFSNFGHEYSWTVQAIDASGKVLGAATTTKNFSAKTVLK